MFIFANLVVQLFAGIFFWWLSDFDPRVTGVNLRADFTRRAIHCIISLALIEIAFFNLWRYWRYNDPASGITYLIVAAPLAIIWTRCLSEAVSHGFHWLIDPHDTRECDVHKAAHDLETISDLIRSGRKEEAIQLCQALKTSGEASMLLMDTILEHLGVPQNNLPPTKPLIAAHQLREQGKFAEAELILNSLLMKNPRDVDAAMMLMRLYAQDLRRDDRAKKVLQTLEQQPHISPGYLEFARRSIYDWKNPRPKESVAAVAPPESVDELLAQGFFGTAIERLEQKVKDEPENFDLQLKLAEAQAKFCRNFSQAEKIVHQIENNSGFSAEQIALAKNQLAEWRKKIKTRG